MLLPSTVESHDATELKEIDISESSIDCMGAMKFTNEEDCGFFRTPQTPIPQNGGKTRKCPGN